MENNYQDLAEELARITREVPEIEDAVLVEEEEVTQVAQANENSEDPNNPPPEEPKQFKTPPNLQARMIVSFLDKSGQMWLPDFYMKKAFTFDEIENLKIITAKTAASKTLTADEAKLLKKYEAFEKYVKSLPFTKEEVEFMVEPIEQVIEKYGMDLGPEWFLGMALFSVLGSRLRPIF